MHPNRPEPDGRNPDEPEKPPAIPPTAPQPSPVKDPPPPDRPKGPYVTRYA